MPGARRYVPSQAKTSTAYPNGVLGFFSDHGLMWREEGEGRLYPLGEQGRIGARLPASGLRCGGGGRARGMRGRGRGAAARRGRPVHAALWPTGASSGPTRSSWPWAVQSRAGFCPRAFPSASRSRRWARWPPSRAWPRRLDNIRVRGALELWRPGEETPPEERGRHGYPDGHPRGRALGGPRGGRGDVPQVRRLGHRRFQPEPPGRARRRARRGLRALGAPLRHGGVPQPSPQAAARLARARCDVGAICCAAWCSRPWPTCCWRRRRWTGRALWRRGRRRVMAPVLKGLRLPVTGLGDVRAVPGAPRGRERPGGGRPHLRGAPRARALRCRRGAGRGCGVRWLQPALGLGLGAARRLVGS